MHTPENTYWLTRDRRRILVADMEDGHVLNCINMLTKKLGLGVSGRYGCSDKKRLCQLIAFAQQEVILSALTDPNQ